MSQFARVAASCVRCGGCVGGDAFTTLNAVRHPAAAAALLEQRLHRFRCNDCGLDHELSRDFVYVDWARGECIAVVAKEPARLVQARLLTEFGADAMWPLFRTVPREDWCFAIADGVPQAAQWLRLWRRATPRVRKIFQWWAPTVVQP